MTSMPADPGFGRFTVNAGLTPNTPAQGARAARRRRSQVENDTYMAFCARIIRAAGKRIATGDVEAMPDLVALQQDLDQALTVAVEGLRDVGYSWAEIASRLGTTRQAVQQRWGTTTAPVTTPVQPESGLW